MSFHNTCNLVSCTAKQPAECDNKEAYDQEIINEDNYSYESEQNEDSDGTIE
jgi:hypothetical protein